MGSLGNPQSWAPYENVKDCSQGFCSLYCPEWCYIIFPPPPPIAFSDNDSKANFSPLVIAIIGILASAFLLVSYYTVISKYCNMDSSRRNANQDPGEEFHENQNQSNNELWQVSTAGLDEALIKLIAVCKYKTGDGLVEGTDCSVCLSEFQENESLRLLPKCSHAFHLSCIDTWLKSHSNCPLCRANVMITSSPLPPQLPSPMQDTSSGNGSSDEGEQDNHTVVAVQDLERNEEFSQADNVAPKMYSRATSQMGRSEDRDIVIEIRDEGLRPVRRSISMDSSSCNGHVSIADILSTSEDDESDTEIHGFQVGVGSSSSKHTVGEDSKSSNRSRSRVLHCVTSPTPMKRSFSSGKFLFTRQGRARM